MRYEQQAEKQRRENEPVEQEVADVEGDAGPGIGREGPQPRRQEIAVADFRTFIVSKEDLIISKLFWAKDLHSELHLADVRNLLVTGYDENYLKSWTRELGLDNLL